MRAEFASLWLTTRTSVFFPLSLRMRQHNVGTVLNSISVISVFFLLRSTARLLDLSVFSSVSILESLVFASKAVISSTILYNLRVSGIYLFLDSRVFTGNNLDIFI
jgi:hypothetical protein